MEPGALSRVDDRDAAVWRQHRPRGRAVAQSVDRVQLITHAVSLGGPETLVTRPARSSHRGMIPEARQQAGISDGLIRLSAGIEDSAALIRDLEQAIIRKR